ncbi:hypothetical protein ALC53_00855, partial [Atta colombica]
RLYNKCTLLYKNSRHNIKLISSIEALNSNISLYLGNKVLRIYSSERRRDSFAKLAHIPVTDSQMLRK